jgi:hypothetical protein
LEIVTFPSDSRLVGIGDWAFSACVSLTSFCLPSPVEFLGGFCFENCQALENVAFASDSKLKRIENTAFAGCTSLTSLCLPSAVEFVGRFCFQDCDSLSRLSFVSPPHVRELLDLAGPVIDIPDSVEKLAFAIVKGSKRKTLHFGHESKLDEIDRYGDYAIRDFDRGFLGFSARTLKVFRSQEEFGV